MSPAKCELLRQLRAAKQRVRRARQNSPPENKYNEMGTNRKRKEDQKQARKIEDDEKESARGKGERVIRVSGFPLRERSCIERLARDRLKRRTPEVRGLHVSLRACMSSVPICIQITLPEGLIKISKIKGTRTARAARMLKAERRSRKLAMRWRYLEIPVIPGARADFRGFPGTVERGRAGMRHVHAQTHTHARTRALRYSTERGRHHLRCISVSRHVRASRWPSTPRQPLSTPFASSSHVCMHVFYFRARATTYSAVDSEAGRLAGEKAAIVRGIVSSRVYPIGWRLSRYVQQTSRHPFPRPL